MYGLLGYNNIWPRYYDLKMWNLTAQKIGNIEKIAFKVVHLCFTVVYISKVLFIYGRKCTKYLHRT